jgi:hypothetical protein
MIVVSLKEAKERGLRRYFTGDPCQNGHIDERNVQNRRCTLCQKEAYRRHNKTEKRRAKEAERRKSPEYKKRRKEVLERHFSKLDMLDKHRDRARRSLAEKRKDPAYREAFKAYMRDYEKKRLKTDISYRLRRTLRQRLREVLNGRAKPASIVTLLGCSPEEARAHIERQFRRGMTWSNWGNGYNGTREWQVDHRRPLSSFDLRDPDQVAQAFHFTNLEPLWANKNRAKGGKQIWLL